MLAKSWKKIGLIILIIACLWNITAKFVKKVSFSDNLKSTVNTKTEQFLGEDEEKK